jgi:hypothetical protein
VTTRKAGVAFAMISLGIGEMVCDVAHVPAFFGGEGGDREPHGRPRAARDH